ncbi:TetR/AcrR family transcriptional regulator [Nocardia carnea]|uniref:TetR/AcrR family transcriptional regulator n=1 Tax=Nocardia carnea TaxID=37328 RepID=UPI002455FEFA|nr:helix-turn-helix domain-containing protein [Nocardia carnea]
MPATAPTSKDPTPDDLGERILDAARRQFERLGVKKTTIGDVAREAGVDRGTVYRRIGSRDDLVRAVTAREIRVLLDELHGIPARHATVEGVVADLFVTVVTRWRDHRLANRVLAVEPDRLLPQLTTEGGAFFAMAVGTATTVVGDALHRFLLPDIPDLTTRIEIAARIVHSFLLQPVGSVDLDSADRLSDFAHRHIVPLVTGGHPAR